MKWPGATDAASAFPIVRFTIFKGWNRLPQEAETPLPELLLKAGFNGVLKLKNPSSAASAAGLVQSLVSLL
jgi:hypothetical protein